MADLLQRIAERADPAAFRELYEAYGPRVKAYMIRQGADAGTAEDLAQETLLTVWRKAALYAGDRGSMTTWVFAIARNLRIDRLRREVPWQELPEGRLAEASAEPLPDEAMAEKERHVFDYLRSQGLDAVPGSLEFLRRARARGLKTAVATASRTPRPFLEAIGALEEFDLVLDRSMVRHPKPHPEIYLLAAQTLGLRARETLVVEDSPIGVSSAARSRST